MLSNPAPHMSLIFLEHARSGCSATSASLAFTLGCKLTLILTLPTVLKGYKHAHAVSFQPILHRQLTVNVLCLCRFAPFPKNKMTKLLGDVEDAKALLAKGS